MRSFFSVSGFILSKWCHVALSVGAMALFSCTNGAAASPNKQVMGNLALSVVQVQPKTERDTLLSKNVLYYGKEAKQPVVVDLAAGPLRLSYESGSLRYIRLNGYEVVRAIYPTLRDQNWRTYLPEIRNEKIEKQSNSFRISYTAHYDSSGIKFQWACSIEGQSDGTIRFSLDGEALSTFQKNRIGICVLHPIKEHAGKACEITQPDGKHYTGQFPTYIQPDQPFKNIRAMAWTLPTAQDGKASLTFAGEVFETEDQRNYGDASYKTYCTPQERPKPVDVKPGDRFQQSVTFQLSGVPANATYRKAAPQFVIANEKVADTKAFPAVGLSQSSESRGLSDREVKYLKEASLSHYRVEVVTSQADWKDKLQRSIQEAKLLGLPLEVAFYPGSNPVAEAEEFMRQCPSEKASLSSISIYLRGDLGEVIRTLKEGYPNTRMGTGTNGAFVALNNDRPNPNSIELLTYSTQPQTHLFDNRNIIENIAGQTYQVESAKKIADSLTGRILPIYVGPVTLRGRRYPVMPLPTNGQLPMGSDVRQMSLFGAAFTVGSLKALAEAGAASATYYETVGSQGLMQVESEPVAPFLFKAPAGSIYPLYYVLRAVQTFSRAHIVKSQSNDPLAFDGIVLSNGKSKRILLANYHEKAQSIKLIGLSGSATIRFLDETNVKQAMLYPERYLKQAAKKMILSKGKSTVQLKPYAIAFIDLAE